MERQLKLSLSIVVGVLQSLIQIKDKEVIVDYESIWEQLIRSKYSRPD
ncbi:MAG: hypothetical protein OFPII_30730 [Osedax symbiont Rs1]|nr:MAG: hypothetical protein OFPII_30730 [Osedax symbiont Rs1]